MEQPDFKYTYTPISGFVATMHALNFDLIPSFHHVTERTTAISQHLTARVREWRTDIQLRCRRSGKVSKMNGLLILPETLPR